MSSTEVKPKRYRTIPIEVEAMRLSEGDEAISAFLGEDVDVEAWFIAIGYSPEDYAVKYASGEWAPVAASEFAARYQPIPGDIEIEGLDPERTISAIKALRFLIDPRLGSLRDTKRIVDAVKAGKPQMVVRHDKYDDEDWGERLDALTEAGIVWREV